MRTLLLLLMLAFPWMASAQSWNLYYTQTEVVNSDGSVTITPTVSVTGNDGGYCGDPGGYLTGYDVPFVLLNGNAWVNTSGDWQAGAGLDIQEVDTFPTVTLQPGQTADLSYAAKVEGICWTNPRYVEGPETPWAPWYENIFLDGAGNVTPSPCFLEGNDYECPEPFPYPFGVQYVAAHPADLDSQQVAQTETNQVTINLIAPNWGNVGSDFPVTISGSGFGTAPTVSFSGSGITMSSVTSSDTTITGTITIASNAPVGTQNVTVTNTNVNVTSAPASFTVGTVGPSIESIDPTLAMVGSSNVQLTISGAGFGSAPAVNLPSGFTKTGNQASTDTRIVVTVNIDVNTVPGTATLTVTGTDGLMSNGVGFLADAPDHVVVLTDTIGPCANCSTTQQRVVQYQVINLSGDPAADIAIGEGVGWSQSSWNCRQSFPGIDPTLCGVGASTDENGIFPDGWSLGSDSFTPAGCGVTVVEDTWSWCAPSTHLTFAYLCGFVHTNQIKINGVTDPPNSFTNGTVIRNASCTP